MLNFFTGQDEIESALETLQHRTRGFGIKILIYANLPSGIQAKISYATRREQDLAGDQHRQDVDHHRQHRLGHRPGIRQVQLVQPEDGHMWSRSS